MPRYVAFFGSLNVGGNRLTMADLRAAFEAEDFTNVETVVASGNVLFDFPVRPTHGLQEKLGLMMRDRFEMDSAVCVRDRAEVSAAIEDNPFHGQGEDKLVHTHFLERAADADQFAVLVADNQGRGAERLALGDRALYIDFADGVADSRLTGKFLERRLGCRGTARNMRSLKRILAKMDEA
jgi:uncharacterized protein (DUF1697 family)